MTKQKLTATEVNEAIIAAWKEQYGKVTKYTTEDGKVVYFRSPNRKEVAAAQAAANESDGVTSNEVLAKAISLGGDVEILTQDKYLFGLGEHLKKVIEKVEGELVEL